MTIVQLIVDVKEDRRISLTLPPEVPTGKAELVVTVVVPHPTEKKRPRTSLSQWAEAKAENWGNRLNSEDIEGFTGRRY